MNPHNEQRQIHICFVAPFSYSVFVPSTHHVFGGIEVQAHLLAKGLARRKDYRVSFVVWDHGQPSPQAVDGVTLHACAQGVYYDIGNHLAIRGYRYFLSLPRKIRLWFNPEKSDRLRKSVGTALSTGIKLKIDATSHWFRSAFIRTYNFVFNGLWVIIGFLTLRYVMIRMLVNRWVRLVMSRNISLANLQLASRITHLQRYDLYERIDPDIFVGFGASNLMAELVSSARLLGKKSIILIASDSDLSETYRKGSTQRNYYGCKADNCHYSLVEADQVVAQTRHQQRLTNERFGLACPVIPNPIDLGMQANPNRPREQRRYVAWIGKADGVKRPDLFLGLARRMPETEFRLIMNPSRPDVEKKVLADLPRNAIWSPRLSRDEVPDFLERAIAFVNTSVFEGFPNVFIESCRAGTPFLALNVDPDDALKTFGCGASADGDFERLVSMLDKTISDEETWRRYHHAAIDYVRHHHDQEACCDMLGSVIGEVLAIKSSKSEIGST